MKGQAPNGIGERLPGRLSVRGRSRISCLVVSVSRNASDDFVILFHAVRMAFNDGVLIGEPE